MFKTEAIISGRHTDNGGYKEVPQKNPELL